MPDGFHDRFLAALAGDAAALAPWCDPEAAEPGLSVYRNTIAKGCADTIVAQFPAVERVVGQAWLAAAGAAHAARHPPRKASLIAYGEAFPDWLAAFPPAAGLPYLANLARMDLMWTSAHFAAEAPPLDPSAIAGLAAGAYPHHVLVLHPAARFAEFDDGSPSLWRALQPPAAAPAAFELEPARSGLLVLRPCAHIVHRLIGPGEFAFLCACRDGESLADAAVAALTAEPAVDLSAAFAALVVDGAFSDLRTLP